MIVYNWRAWGGGIRVKNAQGRATVREGAMCWEYRVEARTPAGFRAVCTYTENPEGWHHAATFERAKAKCQEWLEIL